MNDTLTGLFAQDVTLLVRDDTATDEFGNPRPVYTAGATVKGRLRRMSGQEVAQAGETAVGDWMLYLEPDVSLSSTDRVQVDGQVFEVDGAPYLVYARSEPHHQQVRLAAFGEAA